MSELNYPCKRNIDVDCPNTCDSFRSTMLAINQYAKNHNMTPEEVVRLIRSADNLIKIKYWILIGFSSTEVPCQESERASDIYITPEY